MEHIALYRKYRPKTFDEVIGQKAVTSSLINQIEENKLSHAYLFCGPRGTGKTSLAKILSRYVNCLNPSGYNPCNACDNCRAILDESFLDVIEMDAASNNSVEDIRSLIDGVKFPPSYGKMKVFIIDEAHMLSKGAFNALLKTLEEPPAYVMFILATTEVNKIPQTIISRLLRYDFKRIDSNEIGGHLSKIARNEGFDMGEELIEKIAYLSDGGARDALSSLEMAMSSMNRQGEKARTDLNLSDFESIVGADFKSGMDILRKLVNHDVKGSVELADRLYLAGKNLELISEELVELMRKALVYSSGIGAEAAGISEEEETFFIEINARSMQKFFIDAIGEFIELKKARNFSNQRAEFQYVLAKIAFSESLMAENGALMPGKGVEIRKMENVQVEHKAATQEKNPNSASKRVEFTEREEVSEDDVPAEEAEPPETENFEEGEKPQKAAETAAIEKNVTLSREEAETRMKKIHEEIKRQNSAAASILAHFETVEFSDTLIRLKIQAKLKIFADRLHNSVLVDLIRDTAFKLYSIKPEVESFLED